MIYNSVSLCMHITRLLSYQRQKMIQGRITTSTIAPPGEYIPQRELQPAILANAL